MGDYIIGRIERDTRSLDYGWCQASNGLYKV